MYLATLGLRWADSLIQATSGVLQGGPILSSLFNFVIDKVTANALESLQDGVLRLANGKNNCDLYYANDLLYLFEHAEN